MDKHENRYLNPVPLLQLAKEVKQSYKHYYILCPFLKEVMCAEEHLNSSNITKHCLTVHLFPTETQQLRNQVSGMLSQQSTSDRIMRELQQREMDLQVRYY